MPGDNIEARMNFIVEQQAQFSVDIQVLKERQAETARLMEQDRAMIRELGEITIALAHAIDRHADDADRRFKEMDRRFEETDRRLAALIETVNKLVQRDGH